MKTSQYIKQILAEPLENLHIEIIEHSDPTFVGLQGIIIAESKNMLTIASKRFTKHLQVMKISGYFRLSTTDMSFRVKGELLQGTARKRKKRRLKTW